MPEIFPITVEDIEVARLEADRIIELYVKKKKIGRLNRAYERKKWFVGIVSELAVVRATGGSREPYRPKNLRDFNIPGVGRIQLKSVSSYSLHSLRVKVGSFPVFKITLLICYYLETELRKLIEVSPQEISKLEVDSEGYFDFQIPKAIWDRVGKYSSATVQTYHEDQDSKRLPLS